MKVEGGRRRLLVSLALACAATGTLAQPVAYPTKSIRLIVPAPARTPIDYAARIIGRGLAEAWNQPVVADNRAAGNGVAGQEMVANAQPDGHTLLVQSIAFVTHPLFYKLPYDTERDFIPVARIATSSLALLVPPSFPGPSLKDLMALARQKPGSLSYASHGNGSPAHLAGEMLRSASGLNIAHAAQRSETEALGELMGGRVAMMFVEIAYAAPYVNSGVLRAFATTGSARSRLMSTVPTLAESGVTSYELASWLGVFAPAGTPAPVIERIASELPRILESPGIDSRLLTQGYDSAWMPAGEFQRFLRSESQKFATLVKKTGAGKL